MAFWLNSPTTNVQMPSTAMQYNPQYKTGTTIGDLINQVGQYLTPQQAFTDTMNYETYAAPQREVFNLWEMQNMRPEWERYQLNPFQRQYANQAAAGGQQQMGAGRQNYQTAREQLEQGYYNQLDQARNAYDEMIRRGYENELQKYYESPTAFTTYTQFPYSPTTTNKATKNIAGIGSDIINSVTSGAQSPYYLSRMTTPISSQNYSQWI